MKNKTITLKEVKDLVLKDYGVILKVTEIKDPWVKGCVNDAAKKVSSKSYF